ncbi:MAG: hypothetical protein ACI3W5_16690 [Faecousia sp.]
MKKFLSVILSVALLMCMSVTAFAVEPNVHEQTVSVDIPLSYDYTVTMPANCSLTYGKTGWQHIGNVTVTSENWDNINNSDPYDGIYVGWSWNNDSNLKNANGDSISFNRALEWDDQMINTGGVTLTSNDTVGFYLMVPDWSGAVGGTTYTKTITYRVRLWEST